MWQVSGLYIGLETANYIVLAYDVVQSLRPVLLDPDLLFDRQPSMMRFELSVYQDSSKEWQLTERSQS
jgi:hypothetical protein